MIATGCITNKIMHDNGKITCGKKSNFLDLAAKLEVATRVGSPIVKTPKPIDNFKINRAEINSKEIGRLKKAPITGKIKLIPEKKNLCEPSIKFNLNKDKILMQNPNMLKNKHFLIKSLMTAPIKKINQTSSKIYSQISCIIPRLF